VFDGFLDYWDMGQKTGSEILEILGISLPLLTHLLELAIILPLCTHTELIAKNSPKGLPSKGALQRLGYLEREFFLPIQGSKHIVIPLDFHWLFFTEVIIEIMPMPNRLISRFGLHRVEFSPLVILGFGENRLGTGLHFTVHLANGLEIRVFKRIFLIVL
jgi:hypothetical protein